MVIKIGKIVALLYILIFACGCSALSLGYEKSYCEENGYDYTDAGICGNPMTIYENRKYINSLKSDCQ